MADGLADSGVSCRISGGMFAALFVAHERRRTEIIIVVEMRGRDHDHNTEARPSAVRPATAGL
jgi:hypothetical protein